MAVNFCSLFFFSRCEYVLVYEYELTSETPFISG